MTTATLKSLYNKLVRPTAFATVLALSGAAFTGNAIAAPMKCGNRDHMVRTLDKRFKENRFAMGLASNVNLLELFVSKREPGQSFRPAPTAWPASLPQARAGSRCRLCSKARPRPSRHTNQARD